VIASFQPWQASLTRFLGFDFADSGCEQITTQLDCTNSQTGYPKYTTCPEVALEPEGHEHHSTGAGAGMVEHHQATAAETFTLSRSATDTSNDGGCNKCWCLHFVQVTASVILKMAC